MAGNNTKLTMAKQSFTDEEKQNIKMRNEILAIRQNELTMLARERELYIKERIAGKGLDPNKKWKWDDKGKIEEIVEEKK